MSALPVTVVVPHKTSRISFFAQACLPQIIRSRPAELLIYPDEERLPAAKRNAGAKAASSDFIFFCDDDVVLRGGGLQMLVDALKADAGAAFAYCDFDHVVLQGVPFPVASGKAQAGPWDAERLRKEPFISAMSLVRKSAFPGMDEALPRFDAWDLWLTIAAKGGRGVYVPETLFESHHIDLGVTMLVKAEEPLKRIKEKHGLQI